MSPLPHRRPEPTAEEVEKVLAELGIHLCREGGGTLLTEPVIVALGKHEQRFELLDQNGRQLGFADPRASSYDICDRDGRCVLIVRKVRLSLRERAKGWAYDVSQPEDPRIITLRRAGRWWAPTYAIAEGPRQIGLLHARSPIHLAGHIPRQLCSVEDETGQVLARVLVGRKPSLVSRRIVLVVEIEDQTPDQLRKVALAASVIADAVGMTQPGGATAA